ncbi:MAG: phosphoenolpyruvate carboxykinase (GTP) [Candidatus Omnitrophica bacterium]|nr:phosphoenolpyruvate carboxykinase (GTP) [Candidatus Omnitrophota bacterium]
MYRMKEDTSVVLQERCGPENYKKLAAVQNEALLDFVADHVKLCNPASVFVRTDAAADIEYLQKKALAQSEETALRVAGHSVHFDGINDQGRDKEVTKFLVGSDMRLGADINTLERTQGLEEMRGLLSNIMAGRQMFVLFLCLGPVKSPFSIYAVQLTDSAYVCHSEDILYRPAYEAIKQKGAAAVFFRYVHSAGELENNISKNYDKKRIYIDLPENIVYSVNTQYAGNTVGLKKLSLRLAIRKADQEGWLAEHMFLMAVHGKNGRKSYFTGAFPSSCGKTSTCMVEGERIVGDDIAYLRKKAGRVRAVNVERGIFGIVKDVNADDDPLIWQVLTSPGEVIFSNVLVKDGIPYWQGDGRSAPNAGVNFSGEWHPGKIDTAGNAVPYSHPNARYTIPLKPLKNCDEALEDPEGVAVDAVVYGGRDSDTWPPVFKSFNWEHGVITIAASLESETTSATLGKEGVRNFCLMANLDFLSIPAGKYIQNHLNFVKDIKQVPPIFGVNYFMRDERGKFLTSKHDKRVWLKWMERCVYQEAALIETPIGYLPRYEDVRDLFQAVLHRSYAKEEYAQQFLVRIPENIKKIERILQIYRTKVPDAPLVLFTVLEEQKKRLEKARAQFGDYVQPERFVS